MKFINLDARQNPYLHKHNQHIINIINELAVEAQVTRHISPMNIVDTDNRVHSFYYTDYSSIQGHQYFKNVINRNVEILNIINNLNYPLNFLRPSEGNRELQLDPNKFNIVLLDQINRPMEFIEQLVVNPKNHYFKVDRQPPFEDLTEAEYSRAIFKHTKTRNRELVFVPSLNAFFIKSSFYLFINELIANSLELIWHLTKSKNSVANIKPETVENIKTIQDSPLMVEYLTQLNNARKEEIFKRFRLIDEQASWESRQIRLMRNIESLTNDIKTLENQLRELEFKRLAYVGVDNTPLKDLLLNHNLIKSIEVENNGQLLIINTNPIPFTKYNVGNLMHASENFYKQNREFQKILAKQAEGTAQIYFSRYRIIIGRTSDNQIHYQLQPVVERLSNPHQAVSCLGNYSGPISEAQRSINYTSLILLLLEYLQSITFGDLGSNSFPENCYALNEKGEIIYGRA